MNQSDYWSSVADSRNFTTIFDEKVFRNYVSKNSKILDVGCGYGRTLNELYHAGYKNLVGVDSSAGMLERGKREFPYLNFVQNSTDLPVDDNQFDAVILFGVLCSVVNENAQRNLIDEIKRVLKPNGIIYVNDFLINNDIKSIFKYVKFMIKYNTYGVYKLKDGGILRHHTNQYIKDLFADFYELEYGKTKFKTVKVYYEPNNMNNYFVDTTGLFNETDRINDGVVYH